MSERVLRVNRPVVTDQQVASIREALQEIHTISTNLAKVAEALAELANAPVTISTEESE
jgi:hypothetical protein